TPDVRIGEIAKLAGVRPAVDESPVRRVRDEQGPGADAELARPHLRPASIPRCDIEMLAIRNIEREVFGKSPAFAAERVEDTELVPTDARQGTAVRRAVIEDVMVVGGQGRRDGGEQGPPFEGLQFGRESGPLPARLSPPEAGTERSAGVSHASGPPG